MRDITLKPGQVAAYVAPHGLFIAREARLLEVEESVGLWEMATAIAQAYEGSFHPPEAASPEYWYHGPDISRTTLAIVYCDLFPGV